jgi:hypothetical protein
MKSRIPATIAFCLLIPCPATAVTALSTTAELYRACSIVPEIDKNSSGKISDEAERGAYACAGYFQGYFSGTYSAQARYDTVLGFSEAVNPNTAWCIPENVTLGQKVRVFLKWVDSHPEKMHTESAISVLCALKEAFPCKSQEDAKTDNKIHKYILTALPKADGGACATP